jgi:hypothetical protein
VPAGKPQDNPDNTQQIRKLTLPDGSRVGLRGLDAVLCEVAGLKLTDTAAIKSALLQKIKAINYVAEAAEGEYQTALFTEYRHKFGSGAGNEDVTIVTIKLPGG